MSVDVYNYRFPFQLASKILKEVYGELSFDVWIIQIGLLC